MTPTQLNEIIAGMVSSVEMSQRILTDLQNKGTEELADTYYMEFLQGYISGIETSIQLLTTPSSLKKALT